MKLNVTRIGLLVLLCASLAAISPREARAQFGAGFGFAGGVNYDNFSDISADTDRATGYHLGVFFDTRFGPLALRPGVFYMDVGEIETETTEAASESFNLRLVEIPIDARFRLGTPFLNPYAMVGPVFRINASGDDFNGEAEDFSLAANVGLGLELSPPGSDLRLYPEVRYAFGVDDIAQEVGTQTDNVRLNTFMLRLGVAF